MVSYKDHCDSKVVDSIDFCKHDKALAFLDSIKADGGGDYPEAMLDGLYNYKINIFINHK